MKITINIECDNEQEASEVVAKLNGAAAPKKKTAPAKKSAGAKPTKEEEPAEEVEVEVVKDEEPKFDEAAVTAKARELVGLSSPAALRAVLDTTMGEGVKISDAPKTTYDATHAAIVAKIAELNAV